MLCNMSPVSPSTSPSEHRRKPGVVRDAIIATLQAGSPTTVEELYAAVAIRLGKPVPKSSVRSYLNQNSGPSELFERVDRGTYRLRR
jgi:hypothetical protein